MSNDSLPAIQEPQQLMFNPAMVYIKTLHPGSSQENMTSKLNTVARWLGADDLHSCNWGLLRYEHVLAFVADRQKPGKDGKPHLSSRSINCYLAAIKGVAKQAYLLKQMDHESMSRITLIKSIRASRLPAGRAISHEESHEYMDAFDDSPQGKRDKAIIALLLGCGLRRAEVAGIELEKLNLKERSLRLIGKGEKERKVYFNDAISSIISDWLSTRGKNGTFLFGRFRSNNTRTKLYFDDRTALSPHAIGCIVQEYREKAGLEYFSTHDLRRTFATRLLDKNVDISTVKNMMGHASVTTTAQYDRRGEERQKEAFEDVDL